MFPILRQIARIGCITEPAPAADDALRVTQQRLDAAMRTKLGRALVIRHVDAGSCNGCELEIHALNNPYYNLEAIGIKFAASPRHLGGMAAFSLVLHTWKQDLGRHVHVHALVAGGALAGGVGLPLAVEDVAGGEVRLLRRRVAGERLGEIVGERRAGEARLGVERRVARRVCRAGLCRRKAHARVGGGQVRVVAHRFADQRIERGVAQPMPPVSFGPRRRRNAGEAGTRRDGLARAQLALRREAVQVRATDEQDDDGQARQFHAV